MDGRAQPRPARPSFRVRRRSSALLAFGALIVMILVFSVAVAELPDQFNNVIGILLATAVNGVLALGVTFVIITGGIDLSIGTVMTLSAVMTGVVVTNMGLPLPVGIVGGLADRRRSRASSTAS